MKRVVIALFKKLAMNLQIGDAVSPVDDDEEVDPFEEAAELLEPVEAGA